MQEAIRQIIEPISVGYIFDSHFVIDCLIRQNTNAYFDFVRANPNANVNHIHGHIAKIISRQQDLVRQVEGKSWSINIHGVASDCAAWRRIRAIKQTE